MSFWIFKNKDEKEFCELLKDIFYKPESDKLQRIKELLSQGNISSDFVQKESYNEFKKFARNLFMDLTTPNFVLKLTSTNQLLPYDNLYEDFLTVIDVLGITVDFDEQRLILNKTSTWHIQNDGKILAPFTEGISFNRQKNEKIYYIGSAINRKYKTQTNKIGFSGITLSVPIAKGVRYRAGLFQPSNSTVTTIENTDKGHIIITSKRILFVGAKQSFSVPLNKIVKMGAFEHGICILKENTLNPKILGLLEYDLPLTILSKLVNDENIEILNDTEEPVEIKQLPNTKKELKKLNLDDLPKLKSLLEQGIITQEDFDNAKKKILG